MGAYKFYNPTTQQWEIIKSKSIINADGTNEYTPDKVKVIDNKARDNANKIDILSGASGTKEKANKSDLEKHKTDSTHIPTGLISMWSGLISAIPNGWVLCDGNNGTPNLKDRFIMGATTDATINKTGGENKVTLTVEQMPSHNHTGSSDSTGSHSHSGSTGSAGAHTHTIGFSGSYKNLGSGSSGYYGTSSSSTTSSSNGAHTHSVSVSSGGNHSHTISIKNTGSGLAHENRPAYYALAFIMKV